MNCTICGSPAPQIESKDGAPIFQCASCVFRFSPPCADPPEVLYGTDYFVGTAGEYQDYASEEISHRRMARRYLRRMRAAVAPGSVLDVGCAHGFFLDEARRAGWVIQGVEVSPYAVTAAHERKIPVIEGSFSSVALPDQQYDAVTFFNSLEHIPEPHEVERRLSRIVRPGGVVVIETWDWQSAVARILGLSWHQYDPRYVLSYFSRPAIRALFASPGWELVTYGTAAKWISARRGMDILRRRHSVPVPGERQLLRMIDLPYMLGDLVWIVLRRTTQPNVPAGNPV